jgi:hypothetical protein
MTWNNVPPFSLSTAVALGQDVYEVLIDDWGDDGGVPTNYDSRLWPPPINGIVQPGLEASLAAMMIGPRSTVDRCLVTYNLQAPKTIPVEGPNPTDRVRRLSVDSPLLFTQAANPGQRPDLTLSGSPAPVISNQQVTQELSVWAGPLEGAISFYGGPVDGTYIPTTYVPVTGGGTKPFGSSGLAGYEAPLLHLYLFLKPPIAFPPASRAPMFRKGAPSGAALQVAGVEVTVAAIPVYGRRTIEVAMSMNVSASFRVSSLRALSTGTNNQEVNEATSGVVAANAAVNFRINGANADYLLLHMTPQVNSAGFEPHSAWTLAAYDQGGGSNTIIT